MQRKSATHRAQSSRSNEVARAKNTPGGLLKEVERLARAIQEGRLTESANLEGIRPGDAETLSAANRIVESLSGPI